MVLEDIINRNFPKAAYRAIALQIIYALSVHRLTTGTLDAKLSLTTQNLKDDLCPVSYTHLDVYKRQVPMAFRE